MSDAKIPCFPARPRDGHKGDFGRVLIVAGSRGMSGAAILAGSAALRGGAGLVYVACPDSVVDVAAGYEPCYLTIPLPGDQEGRIDGPRALERLTGRYQVVAIGPGLGQSDGLWQLLQSLVASVTSPLLIDADGLNLLAQDLSILRGRPSATILTPHPGEFARLSGQEVSADPVERERSAREFAGAHGVVLVLKGAGTIVTDGKSVFTNTTGNPGMATGGTGDVLTGMMAALLGQGMSPIESARLSVYWHGMAGDLAAAEKGEVSLTARDLLDAIAPAAKRIIKSQAD